MKKFNLLLVLIICLITNQSYFAQAFTLQTCSSHVDSYSWGTPLRSSTVANDKSRSVYIIPASQLSAISDGILTSTYFYRYTPTGVLNADTTLKIYLKNTAATTYASAPTWSTEIASATLVYDGNPQNIVGNSAGYKKFPHSTNFTYTAGSNLAVFVEYTQTTAQASNIYWSYEYTSPCVVTSTNNSGRYETTTGAFTGNLTTANYRRPFTGFDVTFPPATVVPSCTTVTTPANAATAVSITPTIAWGAVANTHSYIVNMGTTPGGTNVLNTYNAGLNTSYLVSGSSPLSYATTYYVKVVPTNNIGDAIGCTESSFTTLAVPCPSVSSPATSTTGTSLKPTIIWSAVTGVDGYRLSVGTTSGGTDILNNIDLGNVLNYTFTFDLNPSTQYFYTVTAYQGANTSSGCTVRNFTTGSAAVPANDDCVNAVSLTVSPSSTCLTSTSGNTLGATMSMGASPCFGTPNDDVWYSFVATSSSHMVSLTNVVSTGTSSTTDMYFQVLSGACGTTTSLLCSDADTNIVTGLTVGSTYYIRVYTYPANANSFASFNICVTTPPPPPANDECANAVLLTVNPDYLCGSVAQGTTLSATASVETAPSCGAAGTNDDVWFRFVATNSDHRIVLSNVSGSTDMAMAAYSGTCGSLVQVQCSDPNTMNLTGLIVGQEYKVRVWTFSSTASTSATFDICVGTLPPPPVNDDCAAAIVLTVNPDLLCGATTLATTQSATASAETAPTCGATGTNDDIWFKFTATATAHTVVLSNVSGSTDMAMAAYSGTCGSLVQVQCSDPNTMNLTGLIVGQEYKVRVWTITATASTVATFNICVGTPPPPPVNDTCSGAIALTVGGNFAANAITATNVGATTDGTTSCQTSRGDNVWYTVVVPASGNITIETQGVSGSGLLDTILSVHTGTCGSLTSISCDDDNGVGNYSLVTLTGQTPGTILYVSVWRYTGSAGGTSTTGQFMLSAYDTSVLATNDASLIKKDLSVYPNPFTEVLNISDASNVKNVLITDIAGRLVKTISSPDKELYLGELKQGLYLVTLEMKDGSKQTIKAIKK
ncbi:hypothetical protein QF023_001708 [Chryseobacterium sp. SLBN-27]|uniref:T9SS type A sorting domain-containing protein n=1 Tax=Chryseobacterium sp. SLBN-27 TaxID=3042287 RepID=UPI00286614DB|nr:T9SS type A sorting domain-containing protein [Chryseobacterium sp. SLBN-27]MDR6158192.1 hypothetical protein [Chryseobacterium sp. SLBN-27]